MIAHRLGPVQPFVYFPFALSLSKGLAMPQGFDTLSPNGQLG
jgi:hypothetical protein